MSEKLSYKDQPFQGEEPLIGPSVQKTQPHLLPTLLVSLKVLLVLFSRY